MQMKFCLQFSGDDPKQKLCAEVLAQFGRKKATLCSIFFEAFLSEYGLDTDDLQQICDRINELMAIKSYRTVTVSKRQHSPKNTAVSRPRRNRSSHSPALDYGQGKEDTGNLGEQKSEEKETDFQVVSSLNSASDDITEADASYDQQAAFMDLFEGLFGE